MDIINKVLLDIVRPIFFAIDSVVYGLIPIVYKLIISLANVDLYSNNPTITSLLNRIYIIVGIFMLFKLAFSILRYIVDPSAFSDSAKGFTGLVRRVMIAILLLVLIPFLFSKIYEYQGKILNSNILPNLILGTDERSYDDLEDAAIDLQFMMFGPFFMVNTSSPELNACDSVPDDKPLSNIIGSTDMATKDGCLEAFKEAMYSDPNVKASGVTLDMFFKADGYTRDFSQLGALLSWSDSKGKHVIDYKFIISTICGGYLVFLLLSFCIDIAVRAIKLLFLQILSPVAVITSVDPASSSQNDKLKDWGMECFKTYISLFLRLIVIYTVIQMIKVVTAKLFVGTDALYYSGFKDKNDPIINIWVYIFLVLGAFAVAKKIPELIEKAFGIRMSGEINMNPFKNFKENVGASLLGVGAAAVGGGLVNTAVSGSQAFTKSLDENLNNGSGRIRSGLRATRSALRHGLGSGIAGAASTMNRGVRGVMHGERGFKNMKNAYGSAMFARQQREDLHRQGVNGWHIAKADLQRNLGIFTDAQRLALEDTEQEGAINLAKQNLSLRKSQTAEEKASRTRRDTSIVNTMGEIDKMISNRKAVSDAIEAHNEALATGNQQMIRAAKEAIDYRKRVEFDKMMREDKDPQHARLRIYMDQLSELGVSSDSVASEGKDGLYSFDKSVMYNSQENIATINAEYQAIEAEYDREESIISQREQELASVKSDVEHKIASAANSASRVNSPQPEGWMPTGEIQGQYRDTFGPSGWGDGPGSRPGGGLGGGPGSGPRP